MTGETSRVKTLKPRQLFLRDPQSIFITRHASESGMVTEPTIKGRWLALIAALLGWMFDGLEMGLFPLVGRPALRELLLTRERADAVGAVVGSATVPTITQSLEAEVGLWYGVITAGFLVGAATGGVLFGWLGDRFGRIRALTLSVLVYAGCSGASAFATEPWHLAALRFAGALGMGGEWALGVALVMELWPNTSRAWLAGLIGAFGNLGYFIVGLVALGLIQLKNDLPGWLSAVGVPTDWALRLADPSNDNWRLLFLLGATPAVLTLFIRLFVPESQRWLREKESGAASHWSTYDLLAVLAGAVVASGVIALWAMNIRLTVAIPATLIGLVLITFCYLHPARQYLSRSAANAEEGRRTIRRMLLGAGLSAVPLLATWGGFMWVYPWVHKLTEGAVPEAVPLTQIVSSLGAAVGCVVGALLGGRLGRRPVYAGLCVLSLIVLLMLFRLNTAFGWELLISAAVTGAVTASFYGWLPLYLPELFPTKVRATGQGFGFNFGRIVAAVGALQTGNLLSLFDNDYAQACSIAAAVYLVGLVLIAFAPETKDKPLPE
jgi:SHS family sialic acid transporter-like MFS transporter